MIQGDPKAQWSQKQMLKLFVYCFTSISCPCIIISDNKINAPFSPVPLLKLALADNLHRSNLRKKKTNKWKYLY